MRVARRSVYMVKAHAAVEPKCVALNAIQRRVRTALRA
jgi:hypothetical protein